MKTGAFNASRFHFLLILLSGLLLAACEEDYQPKPIGHFRIGLPSADYTVLQTDCPYTFEINENAKWVEKKYCWGDIVYASIRANVQLTYKPIASQDQLNKILKESQDLAYEHAVKADGITEKSYSNPEKQQYGILYQMEGNAATSAQFFITDSTSHFLRGVLYFYSAPNADSLRPVNQFMQNEIVHLIESLEWKNSLP